MATIALGLGWVGSQGKLLCERYTINFFMGSISTTKFTSNSAFFFSSPLHSLFHAIENNNTIQLGELVLFLSIIATLELCSHGQP